MGKPKRDERIERNERFRRVATALTVCGSCGLAAINVVLLLYQLTSYVDPGNLAPILGDRKLLPIALSWKPRIFVIPGVLSHQECDTLIKRTEGLFSSSGTYNSQDTTKHRMSSSAFLGDYMDDPFFQDVKRRMLHALQTPSWNSENLQVARYTKGQQYKLHYDFSKPGAPKLKPDSFPHGDVLRSATLLVYLSDDFEGGETVFPGVMDRSYIPGVDPGPGPIPPTSIPSDSRHSPWVYPDIAPYCKEGSGVLKVKLAKGDAVLFYDFTPENKRDMSSVHGGCPVLNGTKYIAQQWINLNPGYVGYQLPYEAEDERPGPRRFGSFG